MILRLVGGDDTDPAAVRVLPAEISDLALMLRNEIRGIPPDEIRLIDALRGAGRWLNTRELALRADIKMSMAREYLRALAILGVVDMASVFNAPRYRLTVDELSIAALNYLDRVTEAKVAWTVAHKPTPDSA